MSKLSSRFFCLIPYTMRKFIFVLFATFTFVIHASAGVGSSDRSMSSNASYPKAVGLRLGLGLEASYQHAFRDNFILNTKAGIYTKIAHLCRVKNTLQFYSSCGELYCFAVLLRFAQCYCPADSYLRIKYH